MLYKCIDLIKDIDLLIHDLVSHFLLKFWFAHALWGMFHNLLYIVGRSQLIAKLFNFVM